MKRAYSLAGLLLASSLSWGQSTVVTPSALNGVEGSGFYIYNGPITFQQVMSPSQMVGLPVGAILTGMRVRLDSSWLESSASTVTNLDISLGPSNFAPGSLTSSVAGNQGAGTVQVRSGSFSVGAGAFSFGNSPNSFGPLIAFSSNYTYTGGNLLITVSHTTPSAELDFDVGGGISGVQIFQAQSYQATTLTDSANDTGLAIEFAFTAVPEPAFYYVATLGVMLGGAVWYRKKKPSAKRR